MGRHENSAATEWAEFFGHNNGCAVKVDQKRSRERGWCARQTWERDAGQAVSSSCAPLCIVFACVCAHNSTRDKRQHRRASAGTFLAGGRTANQPAVRDKKNGGQQHKYLAQTSKEGTNRWGRLIAPGCPAQQDQTRPDPPMPAATASDKGEL